MNHPKKDNKVRINFKNSPNSAPYPVVKRFLKSYFSVVVLDIRKRGKYLSVTFRKHRLLNYVFYHTARITGWMRTRKYTKRG